MNSGWTELDNLLLDRWHDAVGMRDALKELEEKLQDRLESVCSRLEPWIEQQGYSLLRVGTRYADLEISKSNWLKKKDDPWIWIAMAGLFPYGFRKVTEEHPYVWVMTKGLAKDEQEPFRAQLAERLKHRPEKWINESCSSIWPAGMYLTDYGDKERLDLARSDSALEEFMKKNLAPVLALGPEIDGTLEAVRLPGKRGR